MSESGEQCKWRQLTRATNLRHNFIVVFLLHVSLHDPVDFAVDKSWRPVRAARISSFKDLAGLMVQIFARLVGVVFGAVNPMRTQEKSCEDAFWG